MTVASEGLFSSNLPPTIRGAHHAAAGAPGFDQDAEGCFSDALGAF